MARYSLFIEHDSGATILVNPDTVRVVREEEIEGLDPRTTIVFDDSHSVVVRSGIKSVWKGLVDA